MRVEQPTLLAFFIFKFTQKEVLYLNINANDKIRIVQNIEKILSEILSEKYEAKITIKFSKE